MDIKPKTITQHCIKARFFEEVMKLPTEVKITSIDFDLGFTMKRLSEPVPSVLINAGVTALRKTTPSVEVTGRLTGTRTSMTKHVKTICDKLELKTNTVRVRRMTVQVGKNVGVFVRMTKKIPYSDEKLRRTTVLGLVKWEGSEAAIAKACNTNKFKCKYDVQTIRTVICEEG